MPAPTSPRIAAGITATLTLAALTACSSSHPATSTTPAATQVTGHTTLVFTGSEEPGNIALEDLGTHSAPGGPDIGDLLAFTHTLTHAGKTVGQVHVVAVGVDHKRHLSEATGTIALADGTIQLAGTVSMTPHFSLAVTGGTGAYLGDTGVMNFDASGSTQKLTVHLITPKSR